LLKSLKIDCHCHLFYPENTIALMQKMFHVFKQYGFYSRMMGAAEGVQPISATNIVRKTVAHAKRAGLHKICLLAASEKENHRIKEWVKVDPDLFIPFFNPPEKSKEPEELSQIVELALRVDGFMGLKVLLPFHKKYLNDAVLYPAYEVAIKYAVPILFHTGYPPPGTPARKMQLHMANPALLGEVLASFPRLKVIIAHCGYPWTDVGIALACQFPNVYLDISNMIYMQPANLQRVLEHAREMIGLDKILYGSDGFCPELVEACVYLFDKSNYLTAEEKQKILGLNALQLLNLTK